MKNEKRKCVMADESIILFNYATNLMFQLNNKYTTNAKN